MHDRHFPESSEYPNQFTPPGPERDRENFESVAAATNDNRIRELEQRLEMFDEAAVIWLIEQLGIEHHAVEDSEGDVEDVMMTTRLGTVEFTSSGPGYMTALRNLLTLIFGRAESALMPIVMPLSGLVELTVEGNDGS